MAELSEYCQLVERITGVSTMVVEDAAVLERFCLEHRFHRAQTYLKPEELIRMLRRIEDLQTVSVIDVFQIRLLLGRVDGQSFLFGPFCCESLSTLDARTLLGRCGVNRNRAVDLLTYRSHFPVLSMQRADRIIRSLLVQLSGQPALPQTVTLDLQSAQESIEHPIERPYAEMISDRYVIEEKMMDAVKAGNAAETIRLWRQLHLRMDYLKKQLGYTLGTARSSAVVTRTVLRVASMEAGVPAVILDEITGRGNSRNLAAGSLDEIERNTETLIRELCHAVRRHRQSKDSYLVENVKFHIESHFTEALTIAGVAAHLDIPESQMIARFRAETGVTPGDWLRRLRLKKAAEFLSGTHRPIQEIAVSVGIPDANYFTKLFKAEFGKTPSAYRKK